MNKPKSRKATNGTKARKPRDNARQHVAEEGFALFFNLAHSQSQLIRTLRQSRKRLVGVVREQQRRLEAMHDAKCEADAATQRAEEPEAKDE